MTLKKIKLTKESIEFLSDYKIYLLYPNIGFEVEFIDNTKLEPYIRYSSGGHECKKLCYLGAFSYTSSNPADPRLIVGRYSSISWGLKFTLERGVHNPAFISTHPFVNLETQPIQDFLKDSNSNYAHKINPYGESLTTPIASIGNDCWIGAYVTLNPFCTIGDGAVVAAESVVTKSVPPYEIWGGNPARFIRKRFPEHVIEKLKIAKWFEYRFTDFNGLPFDRPDQFIDEFFRIKDGLVKYEPSLVNLNSMPGEVLS